MPARELFAGRARVPDPEDFSDALVGRASTRARPVTFDVKTDISSQSIFTGVGQLVMHTRPTATGNVGVLVAPEELPKATEKALAPQGIRVLRFRWVDDATIEFPNLARVISALRRAP